MPIYSIAGVGARISTELYVDDVPLILEMGGYRFELAISRADAPRVRHASSDCARLVCRKCLKAAEASKRRPYVV